MSEIYGYFALTAENMERDVHDSALKIQDRDTQFFLLLRKSNLLTTFRAMACLKNPIELKIDSDVTETVKRRAIRPELWYFL